MLINETRIYAAPAVKGLILKLVLHNGQGGMGVTSAWSPLGNFIEGQAHPNVLLILCFSHVITYGSRVFCITFQSILNRFGGKYRA